VIGRRAFALGVAVWPLAAHAQPQRPKLAINGSTARAIGLSIPQSLLLCAVEMIE
jgi:hypothetical protein